MSKMDLYIQAILGTVLLAAGIAGMVGAIFFGATHQYLMGGIGIAAGCGCFFDKQYGPSIARRIKDRITK